MIDNVVKNYGWTSAAAPESIGYITPRVLSILSSLKVDNVLDIGAGNGSLCAQIKQQGYKVVGVEYDLEGVDIAKANWPDIPFYNFGVQDDPQALIAFEGLFDSVVSTEVIEHLFSPHLLAEYAHAMLKADGHLIITTPYHGYLKNLALSLFNKWDFHHTPLWHGGHIKFWSRNTLSALLSQNGFDVVGFSGVGRWPYLWKSMVIVARKRRC